MDYDRIEGPDGMEIRIAKGKDYRTCTECGGECYPDSAGADGIGARIAWICPEHGVHSIVDPFEDKR